VTQLSSTPKRSRLDNEGLAETGFRWVTSQDIRLYSCYWFPNSTFKEYIDFLISLQSSIKSATTEVLIAGDFNAKHTDWGSPANDRRREALVDMINSTGLITYNTGKKSTFHKGSIINLTIASPALAQRVLNWKVLDDISLSDHFYIEFEVSPKHNRSNEKAQKPPRVDLNKFKAVLQTDKINSTLRQTDAEKCANTLVADIHKCCSAPTPKPRKPKKVRALLVTGNFKPQKRSELPPQDVPKKKEETGSRSKHQGSDRRKNSKDEISVRHQKSKRRSLEKTV